MTMLIFTTSEDEPPLTTYELIGDDNIADISSSLQSQLLYNYYPKDLLETVSKLHDGPVFTSSSYSEFQNDLLDIFKIVVAISIVHFIVLLCYKKHDAHKSANDDDKTNVSTATTVECHRGSYQMTNMIINFFLGCGGLISYCYLPHYASITDRIIMPDFTIFAKSQIAYQLWALPVGLILVNESTSMIVHHVCVVIISSMSCFCTAGFRYHCPFFYGVIEISSVPLSIMNMFRNNPAWIEARPRLYSVIRVTFAVVFLVTRVGLWIPQMADFLYMISLYFWTCRSRFCGVVNGVNFFNGIFLTGLQLFWAKKIVLGLLKMAGLIQGRKKGISSKDNDEDKKVK